MLEIEFGVIGASAKSKQAWSLRVHSNHSSESTCLIGTHLAGGSRGLFMNSSQLTGTSSFAKLDHGDMRPQRLEVQEKRFFIENSP